MDRRVFIAVAGVVLAALPAPAAAQDPFRQDIADFQTEGARVAERAAGDPHFGGFIFRNSPEPHAIVMFTRDAEARLRRYTTDPRYRAQQVELTLAQLEAMKDDVSAQLAGLGLRCSMVDGDEEHNRVTVDVVELDRVQAAIAEGRLRVPPKVLIRAMRGCPTLR